MVWDILNRDYFRIERKQARAIAFLVEPEYKGMVLVFRHDDACLDFDDLFTQIRKLALLDSSSSKFPEIIFDLGSTFDFRDYVFKYIDRRYGRSFALLCVHCSRCTAPTIELWPEELEKCARLVVPTTPKPKSVLDLLMAGIYHTLFKCGSLHKRNSRIARAILEVKKSARKHDVPFLMLLVNTTPGLIYGEGGDLKAMKKWVELMGTVQHGVYRCVVPPEAIELKEARPLTLHGERVIEVDSMTRWPEEVSLNGGTQEGLSARRDIT
ncbi:Uu.00g023330.m01.CDS01 [Anthostomella pinea]|uniref:Uu.00g023330.m01.CDS01 n=1 Tax=Anthostomella pinea TaxID=933095 RepID=A0AAI8W002_9PEZI|nr:Uu.00g023330.m01.CDS01 [Anthostomella pinea]